MYHLFRRGLIFYAEIKDQQPWECWNSPTKSHGVTFYKTVFFKSNIDLRVEHDICACTFKLHHAILQSIFLRLVYPLPLLRL